MSTARELLDTYTRTKPMNRAAHELADALRAVLNLCDELSVEPAVEWTAGDAAEHFRAAITTTMAGP